MPAILLVTFLLTCILELGSDESFFYLSNLTLMISISAVLGIAVTGLCYLVYHNKIPKRSLNLTILLNWCRFIIVVVGCFLIFGSIKLSLIEFFDDGFANFFRLILMFGVPIAIAIFDVMAIIELNMYFIEKYGELQ